MNPSARGFTLVELLVTISVIAILIAMLLPGMARARRNAQRVVCATQQHQLQAAYAVYAVDHRDFLPYFTFIGPSPETFGHTTITKSLRDTLFADYGLLRRVWDCTNIREDPLDISTRSVWGVTAGSWDTPLLHNGNTVVRTGTAVWAGRGVGYQDVSSPATGIKATELPRKASERKFFKTGSTYFPWFSCPITYRTDVKTWTWSAVNDLHDPRIMHWRTGINAANPDGSVVFKRWTGAIVFDAAASASIVKFTGVISSSGSQWQMAY